MIYEKDHLEDVLLKQYPPAWVKPEDSKIVIVLSTGKCGTTTISHILNLSADIFAGHELNPRLWHLGDEVFKDDCKNSKWEEIYWATRRDIISCANGHDMVFAEVNHRTSVFLPAMKRLFPKAKYLLLWRDFDETITSGCRWGLYSQEDRNIEGRIYPDNGIKDIRMACAWHWIELYKYLLRHLKGCDFTGFPFEWIKTHNIYAIQKVFDFLNVNIPEAKFIKQVLMVQYNTHKNTQDVPKIWSDYDKEAKQITDELSSKCIYPKN